MAHTNENECRQCNCYSGAQDGKVSPPGDFLEEKNAPERAHEAGTARDHWKGHSETQMTVGDEPTDLGDAPHNTGYCGR